MFKLKIFISIIIFSFLLIGTSSIKNETRELEKKINILTKAHAKKERTLSEVQLDYHYLTSPSMIEMKIDLKTCHGSLQHAQAFRNHFFADAISGYNRNIKSVFYHARNVHSCLFIRLGR